MVSTLISMLVGAVVTWRVAKHYYALATKDLLEETRKLRTVSSLVLYKLQYPSAPTTIKYGPDGEVTGLIVDMAANMKGAGGMTASTTQSE